MGHSQFALLRQRRFAPFFWAQALGAFNDNLYKQALVLALLFKLDLAVDAGILVNLSALLFILPFFLFSALGGQLGDCFPKNRLIRLLKLSECLIMLMGAVGFLSSMPSLMWVALFLMGTHSALFAPIKYSILPQHLNTSELMAGNALVGMGTFLAILLGTLSAGLLMSLPLYAEWVAAFVLAVALLGYAASCWIPETPALASQSSIHWHLGRETKKLLQLGFSQTPFLSRILLANSWFWFVGATYLTQIPAYVKTVLAGNQVGVTLILALFSVGIAVGSLCCEFCLKHCRGSHVRLICGGGVLLSVLGFCLGWLSLQLSDLGAAEQGVGELLFGPTALVMWSFFGLGFGGGLYVVPLYVLLQLHTKASHRTRMMAAANVLNATFMMVSAVLALLLLSGLGLSIPQLFLVVALMSALVNGVLFGRVLWPRAVATDEGISDR